MFERIKKFFGFGGKKNQMIEGLQSIIDHPDIAMPQEEYQRILENKRIYKSEYADIEYLNSNGDMVSREFHSINMSKVIARKMSKLVFNEGCKISIDVDEADDFLKDTFANNNFQKNFGDELEAGYAISGLALRPYFDQDKQEIKISYCRADTFFPLHNNENDISEAAIATSVQETEGQQMVYYTLLEFHEWRGQQYVVRNQLFRSEQSGVVGDQVPLNTLDRYANLQDEVIIEGLSRPLFVYIKLAGKNNINLSSPLSAGIIDNAKAQINNLNKIYDEFINEVVEGKRRIIVSDNFIGVKYDKNGRPVRRFDNETSVFQQLKSDELVIKDFSPSLRTGDYTQTINAVLKIIEMETGFSPGTFSFDGESVKTATEIISENSQTYETRADNVQIVELALKELVTTIFELGRMYDIYKGNTEFEISIDFDDGVFQSQEAKADYYGKLTTFGLISKIRAIMAVLGVEENEAKKVLEEINSETLGSDYTEVENKVVEQVNGGVE